MSERIGVVAVWAFLAIVSIDNVRHHGVWPSGLLYVSVALCLPIVIGSSGLRTRMGRLLIGAQALVLFAMLVAEWVAGSSYSPVFLQISFMLFVAIASGLGGHPVADHDQHDS